MQLTGFTLHVHAPRNGRHAERFGTSVLLGSFGVHIDWDAVPARLAATVTAAARSALAKDHPWLLETAAMDPGTQSFAIVGPDVGGHMAWFTGQPELLDELRRFCEEGGGVPGLGLVPDVGQEDEFLPRA